MEKSVKALFLGLNTVDMQFFIDGLPKANSKIKALYNEVAVGGPATNAAIACSFLGAESTLVTPIGNHPLSGFITKDIASYGVKIFDPIEDTESSPNFASIITNEQNGDRNVFSSLMDAYKVMNVSELNIFDEKPYHTALFDGFYPKAYKKIAKSLKKKNTTIVFDGGSWKSNTEDLLPFIDIAICSNDFIPPGTKTKYDVIKFLLDFGIKKIAITRGENAILVYDANKKKELSVPKITAVDTTAAGDIFHGAFCYYYAFQPNFEQALVNASSIASISCQYRGTRSWMKHFKNIQFTE